MYCNDKALLVMIDASSSSSDFGITQQLRFREENYFLPNTGDGHEDNKDNNKNGYTALVGSLDASLKQLECTGNFIKHPNNSISSPDAKEFISIINNIKSFKYRIQNQQFGQISNTEIEKLKYSTSFNPEPENSLRKYFYVIM